MSVHSDNDSFDDVLASIDVPMVDKSKNQNCSLSPSQAKKLKVVNDSDGDLADSILANITIPIVVQNTPKTATSTAVVASTTSTSTSSSSISIGNRTTSTSKTNCILVNPKQRGNPILKSITNIPWEFDDGIIPDYVVGTTAGILYLSLRYHQLNPDYIHNRLKELGKRFELRVLLVQVDTKVFKKTTIIFFKL